MSKNFHYHLISWMPSQFLFFYFFFKDFSTWNSRYQEILIATVPFFKHFAMPLATFLYADDLDFGISDLLLPIKDCQKFFYIKLNWQIFKILQFLKNKLPTFSGIIDYRWTDCQEFNENSAIKMGKWNIKTTGFL